MHNLTTEIHIRQEKGESYFSIHQRSEHKTNTLCCLSWISKRTHMKDIEKWTSIQRDEVREERVGGVWSEAQQVQDTNTIWPGQCERYLLIFQSTRRHNTHTHTHLRTQTWVHTQPWLHTLFFIWQIDMVYWFFISCKWSFQNGTV